MGERDCELFAELFYNERPATCSAKKIAFTDAHYRECEKCRKRFADIGNLTEWQDQWSKLNEDSTKGYGVLIAIGVVLFAGALVVWFVSH